MQKSPLVDVTARGWLPEPAGRDGTAEAEAEAAAGPRREFALGTAGTLVAGSAGAATAEAPAAGLPIVAPSHYTDRRELAAGGMGSILTAYDTRLRRRVAIKELRGGDASLAQRFARETLITARLEHPGIVSIHEGGRWPDGTPFYAMKLYGGVPLDQLIARTTQLPERLALLPHVLAVADAMAYAHRHRIIHRDLKPGNVMIGEFGETVVIDWGLAKDLDAAEAASPGSVESPSAPDLDHRTLSSDLLGTPAYMAPEQAVSPLVDERADVYALGAILYHVLAGALPYQATSALEFIAKLQTEAPTPLSTRVVVPPDLVAIVERAMAREPSARYATASELAADLRRFLAGQLVSAHQYSLRQLLRRWIGKHRLPLAIAAAAVAALLGLGALAVSRVVAEERGARQARATAEANEASAESLMKFMLDDLFEKLADTSQLGLLSAVADRATTHYAAKAASGDTKDLLRRADVARATGEVRRDEGRLDEALRACQESAAWLARIADDTESQRARYRAHDCIGDVLLDQGDAAGAATEYELALSILPAPGANAKPALDAVVQTMSIAAALINTDPARARTHAERALDDATANGDEVLIAEAHRWLAKVALELEDEAGVQHFRSAVERFDRLASDDDTMSLSRRAVTTFELADALKDRDRDEAAAMSERALRMIEVIVQREPSNEIYRDWQRNTFMVRLEVRRAQAAWRAIVETEDAVRAALDSAKQRDASAASRRSKFEEAVGAARLALGDVVPAIERFRASLVAAESVSAAEAEAPIFILRRARAQRGLGDALAAASRWAEAASALTRSIELADGAALLDATEPEWRELCVDAAIRLVEVHRHTRDQAAQQAAAQLAVGAARARLALEPAWQPTWASGLAAATPTLVLAQLERMLAVPEPRRDADGHEVR